MPLYTLRAWTQDGIICECKHIILYDFFVHACIFVCTGVCNILKCIQVGLHTMVISCACGFSLLSLHFSHVHACSLSLVWSAMLAFVLDIIHTYIHTLAPTHSNILAHSHTLACTHACTFAHIIHVSCTRMKPYRERPNSWYQ